MAKPTVLVIDDDEAIVQLLRAHLSNAGYAVVTASNGEKGLDLMRSEHIDLVLTDFMMPNLNGMEFVRIVRAQTRWSDTKIVFVSANEQPEFQARALELGANDYLPKSLGGETIVKRVAEHLGPATPSSDTHDAQLASLTHRLDRIELLADHLLDVIALTSGRYDEPNAPAPALQTLAQTARKILDAARGTESSGDGPTAREASLARDRLLA